MKEKDFPSMLSGIQRDGFGNIMSASATLMTWMGKMNATRALTEPADDSGTRGELVDLATAQFEKDLAQVLLKYKDVEPETVRVEARMNTIILAVVIQRFYRCSRSMLLTVLAKLRQEPFGETQIT